MRAAVAFLLPAAVAGLAHGPSKAPGSRKAPYSAPSRLDVLAEPEADMCFPPGQPRFPKIEVRQTYGLPSEYQLNQGHAIDALRSDYPRLFEEEPDFGIFTDEIELHDTSGKRLGGLSQYKRVFATLRFLGGTTMSKTEVTHRLVVTGDTIRVRWHAKLFMKGIGLGAAGPQPALVHLDGVSAYELNAKGKIYRHRLENIVLTGQDQQQIQLGFAWPRAEVPLPVPARPFFRSLDAALLLQTGSGAAARLPRVEAPPAAGRVTPPRATVRMSAGGSAETPFERAARERAEDAAKEAERRGQMRDIFDETAKKGPFGLRLSAPQQCESNFDCERPMICCDLFFASVCCTGGMMVGALPQLGPQTAAVPIPIPVERDEDVPPGGRGPGYPQGW